MREKRNWCILTLCALLAILPVAALADIPATPMEAFYVNDYADVISAADEREMLALGERLEDETGAQVVVVTVQFLDGMDIEEYCYQLFNKWGIGDAEKNNGVLLLISIRDKLIHTTVGVGLETMLPASITGKYMDTYAIPYLAEGDFSTGLRENYRALCDKMASLYGISTGYAPDDKLATTVEGGTDFMEINIGVVVLTAILSVVRAAL